MQLYFDTDSAWIESLQGWARETPRVVRVWIFGSRASGVRREKADATPEPDLDVAYELSDDGVEDAYTFQFFRNKEWARRLQAEMTVTLDLQFSMVGDPEAYVPRFVAASGVLIYDRVAQRS